MTGSRQTALISTVLAGLMVVALRPRPSKSRFRRRRRSRASGAGAAATGVGAERPAGYAGAAAARAHAERLRSWLPSFLGGAPSAPPPARTTVDVQRRSSARWWTR